VEACAVGLEGENVTEVLSKVLRWKGSSNPVSLGKSQLTGVAVFRGGLKKGNSLVVALTL
jgi:hypothetical protein